MGWSKSSKTKKTSRNEDKKKRSPPQGPFCCYALEHSQSKKSYTGQTNNFTRRLRQHNGELKGGARYTHMASHTGKALKGTSHKGHALKGKWSPIFRVIGFESLRSVLQFEYAMKKRKVPSGFVKGKNKHYTRGPVGRVTQLEYLLSLGRLNEEPHSEFASNGIQVELCIPLERYLIMARLSREEFNARRETQRVPFLLV